MQTSDRARIFGKRNVALHRDLFDPVLGKFLAVPGAGEETPFVAQEFRLQDEAAAYRTRRELYAVAFPATA